MVGRIHGLTKIRGGYGFAIAAAIILGADTLAARTITEPGEARLIVGSVLIDLLAVVPFLYWLLVIRPKGGRLGLAMELPIIGAGVAWLLLPDSLRQDSGGLFTGAVLAVEAIVMVYGVGTLLRLVRRYRQARASLSIGALDGPEALRSAVQQVAGTGKLSSLLLHDLTMIYYVFFSWRKSQAQHSPQITAYSYHKNANQVLITAFITKVLILEMFGIHLLVQMWSHVGAWIATGLSLWFLVLLWADCRASVLNPVRLERGLLRLRYGLRIQADLPFADIAGIEQVDGMPEDAQLRKTAAEPILGTANIRIILRSPVRISSVLFFPRKVSSIYLSMDEPARFAADFQRALEEEPTI